MSVFSKVAQKSKTPTSCKRCLVQTVFDHKGMESHKQLVVPEDCILKIIRTLHNSPVQGHPGLKKMLFELRKRYYSPNLACKVQKVLDGCENCMKYKSVKEPQLRPPLRTRRPVGNRHRWSTPGVERFYTHSDGC